MRAALEDVESQLGGEYSLVINGRAVDGKTTMQSRNPSDKSQMVGTVASASADQAMEAIEAARRAFPRWSREKVDYRCEYLELVAAEMRDRRFELAAWEVFECGKPWAEADADVAEAIDFCMYYAHQMRELAKPRQCDVPGEENAYCYRPRGVAVVIAPWNFPLAILTGMTAAALVTGNTVVMKPAEQSPVVAAKLMEIFQNAGIPDGVVNYLPGIGEEVGPELVGNPDVDLIAFTGSRTVGLGINKQAATTDPRQTTVKQVIAEMGGKNAIIVDDDADLDEAVAGVVSSAFGYAGQKCSACSRVIVLGRCLRCVFGSLGRSHQKPESRPRRRSRHHRRPGDRRRSLRTHPRIHRNRQGRSHARALAGEDGPRNWTERRLFHRPAHLRRCGSPIADRPGRNLRPRAGGDESRRPGRSVGHRQRHRLRPHRRHLQPQPETPAKSPRGISSSATCTSIAASPARWSNANPSAASRCPASAAKPAAPITSCNS